MMTSNYREIWATPIGEYWLEDMSIHSEIQDRITNFQWNGDDTSHILKEQTKFGDWVKECVYDYVSKFNYHIKSFEIQRAWCVLQQPLQDNFIHTHQHVDIAGVYYMDAIPEHPSLEIIDPRPAHDFNMVHRKLIDGTIASGHCSIQIPPEKYKLVLHPGYLHHGVTHNLTNVPRACVAMNIITKRDHTIKNVTSSS
jgi:uncharacterized protein (TIGR02466 family)